MAENKVAALKDGGFIKLKEPQMYAVRIRLPAGNITSKQSEKISHLAKKYGKGYFTLTVRMGIEIPWVHFENLEEVKGEVEKTGLMLAGCGPRVRPIVACKGTVCSYGLIDTQELARQLDKEFFPQGGFPHKLKIGLAGCTNGCTKPQFNDVGFMAQVRPGLDRKQCNGCGICAHTCPKGAIKMVNGKAERDEDKCIYCGECINVCPVDAWKKKDVGVAVFVGGKFGKDPRFGYHLTDLMPVQDIIPLIKKIMWFYKDHGRKKERLIITIDRVGFDKFKELVL